MTDPEPVVEVTDIFGRCFSMSSRMLGVVTTDVRDCVSWAKFCGCKGIVMRLVTSVFLMIPDSVEMLIGKMLDPPLFRFGVIPVTCGCVCKPSCWVGGARVNCKVPSLEDPI